MSTSNANGGVHLPLCVWSCTGVRKEREIKGNVLCKTFWGNFKDRTTTLRGRAQRSRVHTRRENPMKDLNCNPTPSVQSPYTREAIKLAFRISQDDFPSKEKERLSPWSVLSVPCLLIDSTLCRLPFLRSKVSRTPRWRSLPSSSGPVESG